VTVPGAVSGREALLGAFRDLSLGDRLGPAIRTAEEEFAVTPLISADRRDSEGKIAEEPETARVYLRVPKPGGFRYSLHVAGSLRTVAERECSLSPRGVRLEDCRRCEIQGRLSHYR
jgi:gamma-glutamyltranspeptidase